jgi:putative membrane protein
MSTAQGVSGLKNMSEKSLSVTVYSLAIIVFLLVAFMLAYPQTLAIGSMDVSGLPRLNAFLNSACSVLLIFGYMFIRKKNIRMHKTMMLSAFGLSVIFLLSYVAYHSQAPATRFGGEGIIKYVYFFILITHIILAASVVPLALFTLVRAWRQEFPRHMKIARWTFPIWLYVTVTGVIVYLMISPYYPAGY